MCAAVFSFIHILCRYLHASRRHSRSQNLPNSILPDGQKSIRNCSTLYFGVIDEMSFFTTDFAGISECLFNMHALFGGAGAGVFVK